MSKNERVEYNENRKHKQEKGCCNCYCNCFSIAGAAFGIYYNNQNNMISSAKEALNVKTEDIIELDNQEHTINVADLIEYNAGDFDSLYSASFDTGEQTLSITANEVNQKEVGVKITVKNVDFVDNVLKYTVKISVIDTTMPVWKETVNEIKVIQGEEIKIAEEWNAKYEQGDITWEELMKKAPAGYECWSCSYCGKWTGNFKYR